ncbi:hypothetical protein G4O51_10705 [Candidatus Bathyarchaeota archaeon A05DMB-2]|jgi:CRISPR-associated protein Cmr2|nr:hypothetical protein [Candidatus Bathyarchaeota archaeon A05DMB-2]MBT0160440.1 hypothetical protein [Candidatus Bathyarchaeota archaeon A05DMB-2]
MAALKGHVHSILQQDIRGYDGKEINKLDLSAIPKQAYERLMHPTPKDWFHFPTELTALSNMFTLSPVQLAGVSHLIRITFTLKKPYISLDDDAFYVIDNPVIKDTVLKVPIIRPTTLKGALRYVAMKMRLIDSTSTDVEFYVDERIKLVKLFGSEKDTVEAFLGNQFRRKLGEVEGEKGTQVFKERMKPYVSESGSREGRLIFYPVFFDSLGLDVISPHNRKTRTIAEMGPIFFETVPVGARGIFSLLYFPFDLLPTLRSGGSAERAKAISEMKEDLEVLKEAVPAMLLTYGFAAKKTSGYGVVEDKIDFCIDSVDMKLSNFAAYKNQINLLIRTLVSG